MFRSRGFAVKQGNPHQNTPIPDFPTKNVKLSESRMTQRARILDIRILKSVRDLENPSKN